MAKLLRSLQWRLQIWNAIILLVVVGGFSLALRTQLQRLHWSHVDEDLVAGCRIIEGVLRQVPRSILESLSQDLSFPPGPELGEDASGRRPPRSNNGMGEPASNRDRKGRSGRDETKDSRPTDVNRGDGPQSNRRPPPVSAPNELSPDQKKDWWQLDDLGPEDLESKPESQWQSELQFPERLPGPLGRRESPTYYIAWRSDGSVLHESALPTDRPTIIQPTDSRFTGQRYIIDQAGPWRNIYIRGPRQSVVCVGRSIASEQARAEGRDLTLLLTASSVYILGLLGGVFLSRKAVQPIAKMTNTASLIGPSDLHRRMDLAGVDSELAELGQVLNGMLDRIETSFEQQQRFTADASHELRTPLSIMLSATEHALGRERSKEDYCEELEACHRSARRMHGLVESLMALARVDANEVEQSLADCDLRALVMDEIGEVNNLASEKQIAIGHALEQVSITGVHNLIARVVSNLLQNAIQYTSTGGKITVTLSTDETLEERMAVLSVSDTGHGIPEGDLPRIFDRFYRVDAARSRQTGGYGLGLSICQSIVKLHRGEITAQSQLGQGSTFTVRLPLTRS